MSRWFGKQVAIKRKCQRLQQTIRFRALYLGGVGGKGGEEKEEGVLRTVDCVFKSSFLVGFLRLLVGFSD